MKKDITHYNGFTLVELVVSVGLFAIVVTITMTAYLRLISIERNTRATNDVVTNLSFVSDTMARTIRIGHAYRCTANSGDVYNCPDGGSKFWFADENNQDITYVLVTNGSSSYIGQCQSAASSCNASSATPITDPRINIQNLTFYVNGATKGTFAQTDGVQPQVIFTIQGSLNIDSKSVPTVFTIESGATQRLLDL
jgi:prepilin-type N-terminal cleavage/methylation domain-containing protein